MSNGNERRIQVPNCEASTMMPDAMKPTMMTSTCKAHSPYEDTVDLMLSPDYKKRFIAEYRQTKIRYEKLKAYANRIEAAMVCPGKVEMPPHDCSLDLLREQQRHMGCYLHTLEVRAIVEGIDL